MLKYSTVKLGYNKHSVIKKRIFSPKWSFYDINQPSYNEFDCHYWPFLAKIFLSLFRNCFFASVWMIFIRNMIKYKWKFIKRSLKVVLWCLTLNFVIIEQIKIYDNPLFFETEEVVNIFWGQNYRRLES